MRRRDAVLMLGGAALAVPLVAQAQLTGKIWRIGYLWPAPKLVPDLNYVAFVQKLRELGYVEGQNMAIEYRSVEGSGEGLADVAAGLARLNVDVIVAVATSGALAAKQATTIPIVMLAASDPIEVGLVSSYARPGGNVTGLAVSGGALSRKRLELLKETVPTISRVAVLLNPRSPSQSVVYWRETEIAARMMGVTLQRVEVAAPGEIEAAYAAIDKARVEAVIVFTDPLISAERRRRADLAARTALPVMNSVRTPAELGDLMSYAPNYLVLYRRAAIYVDKILKGAKPADLPVEEPAKFDLVINLKTAKALGITIPQSALLQADEQVSNGGGHYSADRFVRFDVRCSR
jgi:putative tryptophan/tyrosine transport system substrate-binding protein